MSIILAEKNAAHIIGLETNSSRTEFSNYNLKKNHPELSERISYICTDLDKIEDESFDIIISKDVLEHVIGLEEIIPKVTAKLKPGGHMILGWGPLWFSPFGDHGLSKKATGFKFPWFHLFMSERKLLKSVNIERAKVGQKPVESIKEFGMNMEPFKKYKELIYSLGLKVEYFETNNTNRFKFINKIPMPGFLTNYWIRTIYCKLTKEVQ